MAKISSGMYKVYENEFLVGDTKETATCPSRIKNFSVTTEDGTEEWNDFENGVWSLIAGTTKKLTFKLTGLRDVGNTGNDYLESKLFATGVQKEGYFCWNLPSVKSIEWDKAIYKTDLPGGDSPSLAPIEVEITSNGRPKVTEASEA